VSVPVRIVGSDAGIAVVRHFGRNLK